MELWTSFHFQGDNPAALGEAPPLLPVLLPLFCGWRETFCLHSHHSHASEPYLWFLTYNTSHTWGTWEYRQQVMFSYPMHPPQGSMEKICLFQAEPHKVNTFRELTLSRLNITFQKALSTLQDLNAKVSKRQSSFSWIPSSGCHLWQTSHIYVLPCHIWVAKKWQSIDAVTSRWDMFFLFSVLRLRFPFNTYSKRKNPWGRQKQFKSLVTW